MDSFCHLHGHSEYSTLDGFTQIKSIVQKAKDNNQKYIALTDHGNLNGIYKFYTECKKENIIPIVGIEAYIVENYDKLNILYHITLLSKNNNGWKNLLKLHKISYQNFYYKPRISFEDLFNLKNGIICLSGCPGGILSRSIRNNNYPRAEKFCELFKNQFKEDFYIEMMNHKLDFQKEINYNLKKISEKYDIHRVATNDYHYANKEDAEYQDYLICDKLKTTINDTKNLGLETPEFYIKTRNEMLAEEIELDNSMIIAEKCDISINFNGFLLPHIEKEEDKIVQLIHRGLDKYKLWDNKIYTDRLREEFKVIKDAGLIGYFLIVQDYIEYARQHNILVGPGRGSVGGSILAYLIGIHNVDPIKHKLLFSRFYNSGRKGSLPDIDVDFPENKIDLVREYVKEKYGQEKVAHIGTYTYLKDKSALKLICRVLGVDFKLANEYSSIIEDENRTKELCLINDGFKNIVEKTNKFKGLAVHSSIHAAGLLISPIDLDTIIPLRINENNNLYVSNWDMKDTEKVGLVKFDFLSLNTLDVIEDTLSQINIKIEDIPTDDKETFDTISNKSNVGIFQLSSDGISQIANKMKVNSIDDISVVVALYRPGPINSGLHIKYINRKHGIEPVEYAHPLLEEVLKDTYGIFVYQEQIIKAVMVLANFSETEADLLRKAIGKKLPELMKEQKEKFINGCLNNKVDKNISESLWKEIEEFAEYCFNRAHSVEYGYITYYTAYLKTHYTAEFMSALLNNNYQNNYKLSLYLKECENLNIKVLPPSVISGNYNFIAKENNIIFGLKGINGIGEKTAKEIYKDKYKSFEDFCIKAKPSADAIVAMAEAGVLDEFRYNRNQIIQSVDNIVKAIKDSGKTNKKSRSLFDVKPNFNIVDIEELPENILAQKEYNRLNVHLVYNPIKDVELQTPETFEDNVFVEAYIIKVKEHVTKKKTTMANITLATKLGQIDAIIFPKQYNESIDFIKEGNFIAIEGVVEEDKIKTRKCWRKINV